MPYAGRWTDTEIETNGGLIVAYYPFGVQDTEIKELVGYNKKGKAYDLNISIKYFTENEFRKLLKEKNNLCKEIIKDHIIIFNIEKFINYIWRDYYGFN